MKKGSRQVLSKCCPSSSLEKKKIEKKKKNKKDRPFGSLPPRISFHHGALEKRGSVSPLGRRPDLCYDVGTGTPERKQRGRKKQLQRLHRRPRWRWKVPKDTFVFARCAENASIPFDVSRDLKRRRKCALRPFFGSIRMGHANARRRTRSTTPAARRCFNRHRRRQWLRWNSASVTLFLKVVAGVD